MTTPEHKDCAEGDWKNCPACVKIHAEHDQQLVRMIDELWGEDEEEKE